MFSRQEKLILALMATINFTHIVDFVIMMPLGPQLMRVLGIEPHQFGLLVSSYSFAAGISGLCCTLFADRFDRKSLLLFIYTGFALGTLACALSPTYPALLIARSLTGAFGGVLGPVLLAIVSDAISVERRGTAMGIVMGAFSVASVAGIPLGLLLAHHFAWQTPFLILGLAAIVVLGAAAFMMPSMRGHLNDNKKHAENPLHSLKQILSDSNQVTALIFLFCVVYGQFSIIPFLSQSFVFNNGLQESDLSMIYLTGGLVAMIASPTFGRLSDRFGKKRIFYIGALASTVPMFVITHTGLMTTFFIILISCSFFLVMSGRMVPSMTLISSTAPPQYRGSFMSFSSCVQQLALSLSSYVAGLIVIEGDGGRLLRFDWMGWMGIFFTFLAVALVGKIRSVEVG